MVSCLYVALTLLLKYDWLKGKIVEEKTLTLFIYLTVPFLAIARQGAVLGLNAFLSSLSKELIVYKTKLGLA